MFHKLRIGLSMFVDLFHRVTLTISVLMVKMRRRKVVTVPKMMYDEAVIMKRMSVPKIQIDEARSVVTDAEATMKKINVQKSPNQNQYPSVVLMLKFHESFQIWAKTFTLLNCQISYRLKPDHLIHKHTKMKSMKKKPSTKKVDKGKSFMNIFSSDGEIRYQKKNLF